VSFFDRDKGGEGRKVGGHTPLWSREKAGGKGKKVHVGRDHLNRKGGKIRERLLNVGKAKGFLERLGGRRLLAVPSKRP